MPMVSARPGGGCGLGRRQGRRLALRACEARITSTFNYQHLFFVAYLEILCIELCNKNLQKMMVMVVNGSDLPAAENYLEQPKHNFVGG